MASADSMKSDNDEYDSNAIDSGELMAQAMSFLHSSI